MDKLKEAIFSSMQFPSEEKELINKDKDKLYRAFMAFLFAYMYGDNLDNPSNLEDYANDRYNSRFGPKIHSSGIFAMQK